MNAARPLRVFSERRLPAMRALTRGLVGVELDDARVDAVIADVDDHLAQASPSLRLGLLLLLEVLRLLPVFVLARFAVLEDLTVADRDRFLARVDASPRLSLPLVAYKTIITISFYELPDELTRVGYVETRRRWLTKPAGKAS